MTFNHPNEVIPNQAYVWIWLPEETEPVVAGRIESDGALVSFNYGRSYLERSDRLPIYLPELPLSSDEIEPQAGLTIAGCIRDASPDAWGRRIILNKLFGWQNKDHVVEELNELRYLLESGSDRIGALDFQHSFEKYVPRNVQSATLEELLSAVERVEQGIPLLPDLDRALIHSSSLGGARPKAMVQDNEVKMIAKFSTSTDSYNVVKAEYLAMRLAAKSGLNVAPVHLNRTADKDVLLVERFDRVKKEDGWRRKAVVSALTIFGFDEMLARYASYEDLAEIIRHRFTSPKATLQELFGRLVFNVLCGNTDDHARNHAAFWNGESLTLTPAYDICPQRRAGNIAGQAMKIIGEDRSSKLSTCLEAATNFQLKEKEAEEIMAHQLSTIRADWDEICEEAALTDFEQEVFSERMFLNEFVFEGSPVGLK